MKIKSKIFEYGNEKESSWPPKYPAKRTRGVFHVDQDTKELTPGYPKSKNKKYGVAPMAIFDSMPPTYHEGACRLVESRAEWERLDRETGSLTFGSMDEPRRYAAEGSKKEQKAIKQDRRRAAEEALKMVRANPKEINQKWNKHAEKQKDLAKKSGLEPMLKEKGIL